MAVAGEEGGNISALELGQPRALVLANIGSEPKTSAFIEREHGVKVRVDVFEFERGDEPSLAVQRFTGGSTFSRWASGRSSGRQSKRRRRSRASG